MPFLLRKEKQRKRTAFNLRWVFCFSSRVSQPKVGDFCDGALLYFDNKPTKLKKKKRLLNSNRRKIAKLLFLCMLLKKILFLKEAFWNTRMRQVRKLQHNVSFIFCNICKLLFFIFICFFFFFDQQP